MAFCINCGEQLSENAKFCASCGTAVKTGAEAKQSEQITVSIGEVRKCPLCGVALGAFETSCSSCGAELHGVKSSNALKEFEEKIEHAKTEEEKITIVKNFPIPNTKEDIVDFMILASTNFDAMHHAYHLDVEDISDAWLIKIKQCYEKAKILFEGTQAFKEVAEMYHKANVERYEEIAMLNQSENAERFKKSKFMRVLLGFLAFSFLFCIITFRSGKILSGIVATLTTILFGTAILTGINLIKAKIKNMHLILAVVAFVMLILCLVLFGI